MATKTSFDGTLGAIEIGALFSAALFGALTIQTYAYYQNFVKDPRWIKCWVAVVWVFELLHFIGVCHSLYALTVTGWGKREGLGRLTGIAFTPLTAAVVSTLTQLFFARRIWITRKPRLASVCYALTSLRCIFGFATTIIALTYHAMLQPFIRDYRWLLTTYLAIGVSADIVIPICLCWLLYQHRETEFQTLIKSSTIMDKFMLWVIQTGAAAGALAIVSLILFRTLNNYVWMGIYFNVSRLYSNSFVLSLNSRMILRAGGGSFGVPERPEYLSTFGAAREVREDPRGIGIAFTSAAQAGTNPSMDASMASRTVADDVEANNKES
ncbi:hypothetical protein HGRIS_004447 [Hohenbuehelia grisea]|uniref:DUF6534 domain-containing protein n=1 Tax=Hohenbuehelia grisea TaxID=104357 RepID=A0ABR3JCJ9_9AGAR